MDDDDDGSRSSSILKQHLVNIILFSKSFHSELSEMETKCDVSLQRFGPTYVGNATVNTFILFFILWGGYYTDSYVQFESTYKDLTAAFC